VTHSRQQGEAGPAGAWLFQALLLGTMIKYTELDGLVVVLRVKLMKVFYVLKIQ
jgi:hypothetical protein